jgi:hypothetical protein
MREPAPSCVPGEARGERRFGEVRIAWQLAGPPAACEVRISFRGRPYVEVRLTREHAVVPFSVYAPEGPFLFAGQIRLEAAGPALVLDFLRWNGGAVRDVVLFPDHDERPPADEPPPATVGAAVEPGGEDLFPYLFLRPWPRASAADREDRFVAYVPFPEEPPTPTLYDRLAELRAVGDHRAMEQTAVAFIEGGPPWQGQFLSGGIAGLGPPLDRFSPLDARLRCQGVLDLPCFLREVTAALGLSWPDLAALLQSPALLPALDRAWQNLFALCVVLGYDVHLLDELVRTVVLARLLQRLAILVPDGPAEPPPAPDGGPDGEPAPPFAGLLSAGVRATVVLPPEVFPLPPAAPARPPHLRPAQTGRTVPYALGDLELVRRRLRGYTLGEVSHIENVMRGEQKEATRRNLERRSRSAAETGTDTDAGTSASGGAQSDLRAESLTGLVESGTVDYSVTYGPPTEATATGFVAYGPQQAGDPTTSRDVQAHQLARCVTNAATRRLSHKVWRRRATASLDEREETVVQRFDASSAERNLRGVYRWVNEVYEAWVVHYGRRLILETLVPRPARTFLAAEAGLRGIDLEPPVPPAELGLATFRDVSRDPASPTFYAALATRYGADVPPPPPARQLVSATFQSGAAIATQEIALPEGYAAATGWVTAAAGAGTRLRGVIGRTTFPLAGAPDQGAIPLAGETGSLPVGVLAEEGQDASAWVLSVEVEARLETAALERWQQAVYGLLLAAYERRRRAYFELTGAAPSPAAAVNPLAAREAVRRALRQDVMRQLLAHARERLGPDSDLWLGEPRYLQFFDCALEWDEMAFSFTVQLEDRPGPRWRERLQGGDALLTTFLEASWARILLPVDPAHVFAIPYFFASGQLWPGADDLAPTHQETLDLVNEIKQAGPEHEGERRVGEPWTLEVPTAMVLLQDSPDLPRFDRCPDQPLPGAEP